MMALYTKILKTVIYQNIIIKKKHPNPQQNKQTKNPRTLPRNLTWLGAPSMLIRSLLQSLLPAVPSEAVLHPTCPINSLTPH